MCPEEAPGTSQENPRAFLHSGIVCLPRRRGKNLWGRAGREKSLIDKDRAFGSQNNLSSPVTQEIAEEQCKLLPG